MYDKVIKEIKDLIPEAKSNCQYYTANILQKAVDAIEELQKRVPKTPHGRLIDADALAISTLVPLDGKPYQYVHIDNIKNAPTIIPAEPKGYEILKRVDPGTGLTLEQLIEAFVSDPEEVESIKKYIISVNEAKKHAEEEK